jgi:hypothetical protein
MISSEIFDAMPARARERVYQRLSEILGGQDDSSKYSHLSLEDRRAILEILRETKPDFLNSK